MEKGVTRLSEDINMYAYSWLITSVLAASQGLFIGDLLFYSSY